MMMPSTPNIIIGQSKMRQKSMFCAKIYPWQFFHNSSTNIVGNSSRYMITYYCHNLNFYLTEASVHRFYSLNLMSDDIKTLFVCNVMVLIFMKATELGTCYIFLRKHKKSQYKLKVFSKHIGILCAKFPSYSYQICN